MISNLVYGACLFLCCVYSFWRGGAPERIAAAIMLAGSLASLALLSFEQDRFQGTEWGVLGVDLVDQILLTLLALRANRFWPAAVAGIHLLPILTHFTKMLKLPMTPGIYAAGQAVDSFLILIIIAVGTFRHAKRVRIFATDKPWSTFSPMAPGHAPNRSPIP